MIKFYLIKLNIIKQMLINTIIKVYLFNKLRF